VPEAKVTEEEIKDFIRRAQAAHFRDGYFVFENRTIITRDLFAPGVDTAQKAREIIQNIRSGTA